MNGETFPMGAHDRYLAEPPEERQEEDAPEVIPCPPSCGGCACHIAPPCAHCEEGHGEESDE